MALLLGDRDDDRITLEVQFDMRANTDQVMLREWKQTEHGLMDLRVMSIPVGDSVEEREALVRDLAKVLGVKATIG